MIKDNSNTKPKIGKDSIMIYRSVVYAIDKNEFMKLIIDRKNNEQIQQYCKDKMKFIDERQHLLAKIDHQSSNQYLHH